MGIDEKFKIELKLLKDPQVKKKLKSLIIEKHKLMKQKETEQIEMHNKRSYYNHHSYIPLVSSLLSVAR